MKYFLPIAILALTVFCNQLSAQANGCFAVAIEDMYGLPGESVVANVTLENASSLLSMQFSITYDPSIINYTSVSNFNLTGLSSANFGSQPGVITFSWFDPTLNGVTLPDGTVVFQLHFIVTGTMAATGLVDIGDIPTVIEIITTNGQEIPLNVAPGHVGVMNNDNNLRAIALCVDTGTCLIQGEGSIELAVTGGTPPYSYQWSGPGGFTATQQDLSGVFPGAYQVTVTDSEGHTTEGQPLSLEQQDIIEGISSDTLVCAGTSLQLWVAAPNAVSLEWQPAEGLSCTDCAMPVLQPNGPNVYTVTATNAAGCAQTANVFVDVRSYLDFGLLLFSNSPLCAGDTLRLESHVLNAQLYEWTGPAGFVSNEANPVIGDVDTSLTGNYNLHIIDDIGCETGASFGVIVAPIPAISGTIQAASCPYEMDGNIDVTVNGGASPYLFSWSNGYAGEDPDALAPGGYSLTIKDANQCIATAAFEVGPDPIDGDFEVIPSLCGDIPPAIVVHSISGGAGGPFSYSLDGGFTILPLVSDTLYLETFTISPLFYDAAGCVFSPLLSIIINPAIILDVDSLVLPTCPGTMDGRAFLSVTGGTFPFFFEWSNGAETDTPQIDGLSADLYTATVTDSNGCMSTLSFDLPAQYETCANTLTYAINIGETGQWCDPTAGPVGYQITQIDCTPDPSVIDFSITNNASCIEFEGLSAGRDTICLLVCRQMDTAACYTLLLDITVLPTPVWPGDANKNGIVNQYDLLNLGLAFGAQGPVRPNASTTWMAQPCPDWEDSTPISLVNFKHTDTDGNGLVESIDTQAIAGNWGLTHVPNGTGIDEQLSPIDEAGIPVFMQVDTAYEGAEVVLPIILGTLAQSANQVFGLAFKIQTDDQVIEPSSLWIDWEGSWLGTTDELLTVAKTTPYGQVYAGISRTDGTNADGYGQIGTLHARLREGLLSQPGSLLTQLVVDSVLLRDKGEMPLTIFTPEAQLTVLTGTETPILTDQEIRIFPNPAKNSVWIDPQGNLSVAEIEVLDINGRKLLGSVPYFQDRILFDISLLNDGIYLLRVITSKGSYLVRLVKEN